MFCKVINKFIIKNMLKITVLMGTYAGLKLFYNYTIFLSLREETCAFQVQNTLTNKIADYS